jgi:hypothetical protein
MTKKPIVLSIEKIVIDGKPAIKFHVDGTSKEHKEVLFNAASKISRPEKVYKNAVNTLKKSSHKSS